MPQAKSWLGAAAGLFVLAGGLAIIDQRVRYSFMQLLDGRAPTGEIADATAGLQTMAAVVITAIHDQSIAHAPLTIFAIAGMVLVLFMLKT